MYLPSSTSYILLYLGTSTFLKVKYKIQASTRKNVLSVSSIIMLLVMFAYDGQLEILHHDLNNNFQE